MPARLTALLVVIVVAGALCARARAEQPTAEPASDAPAQPERPTTAADVEDAPAPEDASGRVDEPAPGSFGRSVARVLLFVPRVVAVALFAPIRGALWSANRFAVGERIARLFSGDSQVTVYPAAALESGFWVTWGVGASWSDMFGHGETLTGRFLFGGEVKQIYGVDWRSGRLLGDTELGLVVEAVLLENSRFWGYGLADAVDASSVVAPIDPADGPAVLTRFDQDALRFEGGVSRRLVGALELRLSGALLYRRFDLPSDSSAVAIEDVFMTDRVVGYDDGLSLVYSELAAGYDSSRQPNPYVNAELPSTGWRAEMFAGAARGIGDDPSAYFRYGADVARFIDLYGGDRVLVLRGAAEGVTGGAGEVNFVDLPSLGGSRALRAYPRGRFRDRTTTLAAAEYRYPVNQWLAAYGFGETGGAWRSLADVDPSALRWAAGGGLLVLSKNSFLFRLQAGYGDEGIHLALSFNPAVQTRPRTRP